MAERAVEEAKRQVRRATEAAEGRQGGGDAGQGRGGAGQVPREAVRKKQRRQL